MKVYTCINFKGHWPVGASAVVVASNKAHAKRLLVKALAEHGLNGSAVGDEELEFVELPLVSGSVRILNDGNY